MSMSNKANLSALSNKDFEQFEALSHDLLSSEMEAEPLDKGIDIKPIMLEEYIEADMESDEQTLENEVVETDIGEQEIEIESEMDRAPSPDEILPDYKATNKGGHVPPLRLLNIAPKPAPKQVPIAVKTVGGNVPGQQIVFIQSSGTFRTATSGQMTGQQIKIVSPQGQSVSLPNFQNITVAGKPVTLRPAKGNTIPVKKVSSQQVPKNVLTKVVIGNQQNLVLSPTGEQQIKFVQSSSGGTPTKTITLAQAQQMGLIAGGKLQQILPQGGGSKQSQTKTIKVIPQQQPKSPTKILPHPIAKSGQRLVLKQGGQVVKTVNASPGTVLTTSGNQLIRVAGAQSIGSSGQIHQINVPGKGVQYIRFMASTTAATSSGVTSTSNATIKTFPQVTHSGSKVVPVAGIAVNRSHLNKGSNVSQSIIKVVHTSGNVTRPVAPKPTTTQRVLIPNTTNKNPVTTIPASALSQLQGATIIPSNNNVGQIVMLPSNYVQQLQAQANTSGSNSKIAIPPVSKHVQGKTKLTMKQRVEYVSTNLAGLPESKLSTSPESAALCRNLEQNGIRPRKPCNCTKSQCLKLYCDCFANGEFCYMCNCLNCFNNLENEDSRHKAIKSCLERNPNAFRPKIGKGKDTSSGGDATVRKHTKGCNCKRSGCLKNYCECYEAKIACSSNCKCMGCRNIEDSMDKKTMRPQVVTTEMTETTPQRVVKPDVTSFRQRSSSSTKQASNFINTNVVEATNACLLAFADNPDNDMQNEELAKQLIIQEYGRCLVEVIEASQNSYTNI